MNEITLLLALLIVLTALRLDRIVSLLERNLGLSWYRRGSAWATGTPLVTEDGVALRPEDIPVGRAVPAWPLAGPRRPASGVLVVRLPSCASQDGESPSEEDDVLVAFSRRCPHAGCAVSGCIEDDRYLRCTCHGAAFDLRRDAAPSGGPATAPLPQLPLTTDGDGAVVAAGHLQTGPLATPS